MEPIEAHTKSSNRKNAYMLEICNKRENHETGIERRLEILCNSCRRNIWKNHKIVHGQLKSEKTSCHKEKRLLVFVSWVGTSHHERNSSPFFLRQSIKGSNPKSEVVYIPRLIVQFSLKVYHPHLETPAPALVEVACGQHHWGTCAGTVQIHQLELCCLGQNDPHWMDPAFGWLWLLRSLGVRRLISSSVLRQILK